MNYIFDIIIDNYLTEELILNVDSSGYNIITYSIINRNTYFVEKLFNTPYINSDLFTQEIFVMDQYK